VPVTSPPKEPEKETEVVAWEAVPVKLAVMVPAAKFPLASLLTIVLAVLVLTAALAASSAEWILAALEVPTWFTVTELPELDTSPVKLVPESPVAVPVKLAVIVPAEKFPEESRFTIVEAVFKLVAAFAASSAECTLAALLPPTEATTVLDCPPVTSPLKLPVKVPEELAVVAVVALPDKLAVMVPAEKLPEPSRFTRVPAVFKLVAAVTVEWSELSWLPDTPPKVLALSSTPPFIAGEVSVLFVRV
jgi:hypothetical protein